MVCTLLARGARAEDPFRGLRAGPVRCLPLHSISHTFADLPNTPKRTRTTAKVRLALRINGIRLEKRLSDPSNLYLRPEARDVVAHGHEQHDREPKDGADNYELRALGAVLAMHKEENDQRGLKGCDDQRNDDV